MYSILARSLQNRVGFWVYAQWRTPRSAYDAPRPPNREGLLAFGNHNFTTSALNSPLAPQTKMSVLLAPQHTKS